MPTAELIKLDGEYHKALAVPGAYYDRDSKCYVVDPNTMTPRSATVALKLFPELVLLHPELDEIRARIVQDVRPFDNATAYDSPIGAYDIRRKLEADLMDLYEFQGLDLGYMAAVLQEHGGAYIGWERGLGKTLGTIALADELGAERVLIVAPNTAKGPVWEDAVTEFLAPLGYAVEVLPNVKKKREDCMSRVRNFWTGKLVLIVHYEALDIIAKENKSGTGWNKYGEWDLVVADEAHRIKNPKAKMTRALKKVPTRWKLALSGSIIQNHAEELFSVLQWLFPDRYRSKWRDWNDRFLDYVEGGYSKIFVGIKLEMLDELRAELGVFMVYRRKEDELDLPKRTDQTLSVAMNAGQARAYEELQQSCIAALDDDSLVVAEDGLPMLTKLRQIATGLELVSDIEDSSKMDLAVEMIEDSPDEAFVVFSWFKAGARAMAERLEKRGIEAFVVDGDVKQNDRNELIARFQNGEGRVFIGTLATLGESVNLQRASQSIFLDRSWNPALNVQAEDRIYRIGQDKPVTITHLVAKGTVDEYRVMPTIKSKEALRALILGVSHPKLPELIIETKEES